ncbi:MAG: ArsR/SmtB family transcription factor [Candidatus Njordarchaeia archaeon]
MPKPMMWRGKGKKPWWINANIVDLFRMFTVWPRMAIIKSLAERSKTTSEIYDEIISNYGMNIPRSLIYYHLDSLEKMGIIEQIEYRETGKGGAPEKVWKLKVKKIIFDIVEGEILLETKDTTTKIKIYND